MKHMELLATEIEELLVELENVPSEHLEQHEEKKSFLKGKIDEFERQKTLINRRLHNVRGI